MIFTEWNLDDAIAVAREEGIGIGIVKGSKKTRKEERRHFLKLLDQGLTAKEIKRRLIQEK